MLLQLQGFSMIDKMQNGLDIMNEITNYNAGMQITTGAVQLNRHS